MSTTYHVPYVNGAPANAATLNVPLGTLDQAIVNLVTGALSFTNLTVTNNLTVGGTASLTTLAVSGTTNINGGFVLTGPALRTLSGNSFSVTALATGRAFAALQPEGSLTTDVLDTISGAQAGQMLVIKLNNEAHAITINHSTVGNGIRTPDGLPIMLNGARTVTLIYNTGSYWVVVAAPNFSNDITDLFTRDTIGYRAEGNSMLPMFTAAPTTFGVMVASAEATTRFVYFQTAAVLNDPIYINSAFTLCQSGYMPQWRAKVKSWSTNTFIRIHLGMFTALPSNSDLPTQVLFGFRFSTGAGDVNWQAITGNGASLTVVNTGVLFAATTDYDLAIQVTATAALFFINSVLVATITTTLPSTTLTFGMGMVMYNLSAAARLLQLARMSLSRN